MHKFYICLKCKKSLKKCTKKKGKANFFTIIYSEGRKIMTRYNYTNPYSFMDDLKKLYIFKKIFLSHDSICVLSEIIGDALKVNKKYIINNLEVHDLKEEIFDLNYYKNSNKIVCYIGNLEFIIRMHKNVKSKLFHEKTNYTNKNYITSENEMYTYIIRINNF